MRIVVSCLQSLRPHKISAYAFWREYFFQGIADWGGQFLEVPDVDWAEGITFVPGRDDEKLAIWKVSTWQRTLDYVLTQHRLEGVDMFLSYLYPCQVESSAIRELTSAGIPCVNFFCDNVREFRTFPEAYRPFSLHWVPEFEAQGLYRKAGAPFIHAPMPCWVDPCFRSLPVTENGPSFFAGTCDVLRQDLLGKAFALGADFQIFGHGWRELSGLPKARLLDKSKSILETAKNQFNHVQQHGMISALRKLYQCIFPFEPAAIPQFAVYGPLRHQDFMRATRERQVAIGVNRVPTTGRSFRNPKKYSRLRDIEAPMMGACYLTERCPGIDLLYEPGHEIELYDSAEELRDKLAMLARDPLLRRKLRENGQKRALSDHTVMKSLSKIWNAIR